MGTPIILYDSECSLCVRFRQTFDRTAPDHAYNFICARSEDIYDNYPQLNQEDCLDVIHMVKDDGSVLAGPDVISELALHHPGVSKFSWLIESEMGQKAIDLFYSAANKYRDSLLNRCPKCKTSK